MICRIDAPRGGAPRLVTADLTSCNGRVSSVEIARPQNYGRATSARIEGQNSMRIKAAVRGVAPSWLVRGYSWLVWQFKLRPQYRRLGAEGVFEKHYRENGWASDESRSGTGSTLQATIAVRRDLPKLIADYGITTMLDIPCGDFNWMKEVDLSVDYIGADIVPAIVEANQRYADDRRSFIKLNLISDPLPRVDLIFCRDCLFHLSYKDIRAALANIRRSGTRYLLTTSFPDTKRNKDIVTGEWRALNLRAAPFSLPKPIAVIDEGLAETWERKVMGLWSVDQL